MTNNIASSVSFKKGDRLKLANPYQWVGQGSDIRGIYTVTDVKIDEKFGSGVGLLVTPAIQPNHAESLNVWYDSAHFINI